MMKRITNSIAELRHKRAFDQTFKDVFDRPTWKSIRKWSTQQLHNELAYGNLEPAAKSMVQSILKSREAWDGPARHAVIVSGLSLLCSIAAVCITYSNLS